MSETLERHEFGAEVGRLLDLVVHALYSDRDIFLRELVANAADAMDRRRFESLSHAEFALPADAKIRIVPDKAARTLLISDNGIGMSKDELLQNLGTIARSGTRAFGQSLADAKPEDRPSLIGQFGVGFYAAFMVAERVEVTSRRPDSADAWCWSSEGQGNFTLAPAMREDAGTDIVLRIKPEAEEFLEPSRLQAIIRRWADHISVPIVVAGEDGDVAANEGTALWRKPKAEITEDDYTDFYRHLGHLFDTPWLTLHWRAEGAMEFTALLFVPSAKPFMAVEDSRDSKVRLHVRRMFITDDAHLLPSWLRFVQGVVDTEDLPLNVSREMLQSTPVLARIRKAVTSRVLTELKNHAKTDAEKYTAFWKNFGPVLKEGVWEDHEHRKDIAPLLRFASTAGEDLVSLPDYVARMQEGQEAIYVLVGDDARALAHSPQLEGFRARGIEVLLLSDQVDAFWPERLAEFEGKPIRSVSQGIADLSKLALQGDAAQQQGEDPADTATLVPALKDALKEYVSDVRVTDRLVDSAVVLSAVAHGPDLAMQRLMRRAGRDLGGSLPVLEINPRHPLIRALAARAGDVADAAGTLLDLALVQDGEPPRDPASFARQVATSLTASFG